MMHNSDEETYAYITGRLQRLSDRLKIIRTMTSPLPVIEAEIILRRIVSDLATLGPKLEEIDLTGFTEADFMEAKKRDQA